MQRNALDALVETVLLERAREDDGPMQSGAISGEWLLQQVQERAQKAGITFNWKQAVEHWSRLVQIGVIATLGNASANYAGRPHTFVTKRGRVYLERGDQSPHSGYRYIDSIKAVVKQPDAIALAYVEEAVGAWQAQLHRATMVMIGCAYERIVLELANVLAQCTISRKSDKLSKKLNGPRPAGISDLFDDVRDILKDLDSNGHLPGHLADAWDRRIASVFDFARGLRNESGHPTRESVDPGEAESALVVFPDFYERMHSMTEHVRRLS